MLTTREAMEAALVAHPDDMAAHAAYADLLIEEDDPRGDFIRLQLSLEDPSLSDDRRAAMQEAERELLRKHEAEWLGPVAPFIVGDQFPGEPRIEIEWKRGWVDTVRVIILTNPIIEAMVQCSSFKMMRSFTANCRYIESFDTAFSNLEQIIGVLRRAPITILRLMEAIYGDAIIHALIQSRLLLRLSSLILMGCHITDEGVENLATHANPHKLQFVNLECNLISPIGVEALRAVGIEPGPQYWDTRQFDVTGS